MPTKPDAKLSPEAATASATESPAWHPNSYTFGLEFYDQHKGDADRATPPELHSLAGWLFSTPTRIVDFQAKLLGIIAQFGTPNQDPARPFNRLPLVNPAAGIADFLGWLQAQGVTIQQLSHAQFVQIWHVFVEQEDVRLLQPYSGSPPLTPLGW